MEEELKHLQCPLFREITVQHIPYRYFGGTAYLGIPQNKGFLSLYADGLSRFGLNNGTSRNNNIQLGIYNEAEQVAANRFGSEAALITSSGWLAAQIAVQGLSGQGIFRYAPDTHPSLWQKEKPDVQAPFTVRVDELTREINQSEEKNWVIVSNSLNNLHPEVYDFSFIENISKAKRLLLIVDDSHGIGILNGGKGIMPAIPRQGNVEIIIVASMAKALGLDAGLILGTSATISRLKDTYAFLGASPPSAAGLYAFMQASAIYEEEQKKLLTLTSQLANALSGSPDWCSAEGFPVFLSADTGVAAKLEKHQILISSFAYPDKYGSLLNRIVLSSWHTFHDIEELILALGI